MNKIDYFMLSIFIFLFFKQKTAYEMRISGWSSDVCSSDLIGQQGQELYNTERKPTPEGLAGLPGDYGQMRPGTPQLGPPLPGDLGGPILERQRQLGITPGPSMDDQAALAERQRLAQQAQKARQAGGFFTIATRPAPAATARAGTGTDVSPAGDTPPPRERRAASGVGNEWTEGDER